MKSNFNTGPGRLDSLADLAVGEAAVVREVDATDPIGRRLMDLGLLPETPVRAVRRAPLGDPTVYELRGYRLCLRSADAARVGIGPATLGEADAAEKPEAQGKAPARPTASAADKGTA